VAGFRRDLGETHAGRRIGNADQVFARGALDLASAELRLTFQRLIAMRAVEFEFVRVHGLHLDKRNRRGKSISKFFDTFCRQIALDMVDE
jgi:hypothetical protein